MAFGAIKTTITALFVNFCVAAPRNKVFGWDTSLTDTCNVCSKFGPKSTRSRYENRLVIATKANICWKCQSMRVGYIVFGISGAGFPSSCHTANRLVNTGFCEPLGARYAAGRWVHQSSSTTTPHWSQIWGGWASGHHSHFDFA